MFIFTPSGRQYKYNFKHFDGIPLRSLFHVFYFIIYIIHVWFSVVHSNKNLHICILSNRNCVQHCLMSFLGRPPTQQHSVFSVYKRMGKCSFVSSSLSNNPNIVLKMLQLDKNIMCGAGIFRFLLLLFYFSVLSVLAHNSHISVIFVFGLFLYTFIHIQ